MNKRTSGGGGENDHKAKASEIVIERVSVTLIFPKFVILIHMVSACETIITTGFG